MKVISIFSSGTSLAAILISAAFAQSTDLDALRSAVSVNESLYDQMEAVYVYDKEPSEFTVANSRDLKSLVIKETVEVIGQWYEPMYYAKTTSLRVMGDSSEITYVQEQAFDGSTTRLNHFGQVGNIVKEKVAQYSVKPTFFGAAHYGRSASLSKLLNFIPDSGPYLCPLEHWRKVRYFDSGVETKGGEQCRKIELAVYTKAEQQNPSQSHVIWLSTVHNYLPMASDFYTLAENERLLVESTLVTQWRQVTSGIAVPARATTERYVYTSAGDRQLAFTRKYELLSCILNADNKDVRFSHVDMDHGMEVYVVEGGKITDTLVDGKSIKSSKVEAKKQNSSLFWLVFIFGNVVFLLTIGALVAVRAKTLRSSNIVGFRRGRAETHTVSQK